MKTSLGVAQLLDLSLFRGELPETVEWLLDIAEERTLEEGEVLIRPDETNNILFIIIEGSLRVELEVLERQAISHIGAGECVGELSVLDGQPTAAYVVADRRTRLMLIDRESLWRLIYTSHVVAKNLLYMLSARVRHDNVALSQSFELQHLCELNALTDALTGLYNRNWLAQSLPRLIERAEMSGEGMAVLLLDADHFKEYNDSYGHLAGDEALRMLGATIVSHIRPNDSAVRYGGEEVLVILPNLEPEAVIATGERIRKAIGEAEVMGANGSILPPLTVSIGASILTSGQQESELIAEADRALYLAKAQGRDRLVAAWVDKKMARDDTTE